MNRLGPSTVEAFVAMQNKILRHPDPDFNDHNAGNGASYRIAPAHGLLSLTPTHATKETT